MKFNNISKKYNKGMVIDNKLKIIVLFFIFIILLTNFASAGIIAQLGMQGLSFIDPQAGQAVNSIVNVALCVANPAACAVQKITSVVSQALLNQVSKINPSLGKIVNFYNQIKPLIDSKDVSIKEDLQFNDQGLVDEGILQIEHGKEADLTNFFDNDKNNFVASNLRAEKTKEGITILSFNEENSYFSIIDKVSNKKVDFRNIVASDKGDSYLSLDQYGNIFSASFLVNDKGGVYNFNENIVKAPANTRVSYKKGFIARPSKTNLDIPDGETLTETPIVKDGVVEINGKNIKLPDGNVLNEGILSYNAEGAYIAKGSKTRINGDLIEAYGNDVCLFKCSGGNFVLFQQGQQKNILHIEGSGFQLFSSLGVSTHASDKIGFNNLIALPERGYFQMGDESKWINNFFGVSGDTYSQETYNQVIKFQQENNLKLDGVIGRETLASIYGFPKINLPEKGYFSYNEIPLEIKDMLEIQNNYDSKQIDSLIKNYQKSKSIKQDGLIGPNTIGKLREEFLKDNGIFYPDNIVIQPRGALLEVSNGLQGITINHISGNGDVVLGNYRYNYGFYDTGEAFFAQEVFPLSNNKGYIPSNFIFEDTKKTNIQTNLKGGIKFIGVSDSVLQETIEKASQSSYYKTPHRCGANFRCVIQGSANLEDTEIEKLFGSTRGFDAKKLPAKIMANGGTEVTFDELEPLDVVFFQGDTHVATVTKIFYDEEGKVSDIEFTHQFANANGGVMQKDTLSKFLVKYSNYKPNKYMRVDWSKIGGKPEDNLVTLNQYNSESVYFGELLAY
ncbi:MAG: peptidoglycan-binding protein [Nanoarchaeota archaeon]